MSYWVYLIQSLRNNRYISYVGYSKDLKKRLKLHNTSKGAKFTKGNYWILVYKKLYSSKNEAMKAEYKLKKNYKLRKKLKQIFNNK